jgi:signal transduction histidine kinase
MVPYLQALMSATATIVLLVGLLVFLVFRKEDDRSSRTWLFGSILIASGMITLLFRHHLPNFIGYGVNNFIMMYAMVLFRNSFWMIEKPDFKPSIYPLLFCLYHGSFMYLLTFTEYASEIGLVAAINWTILYMWLFYDAMHLKNAVDNKSFLFFQIIGFLGIVAWGLRAFLAMRFDIVSASDPQALNALTLLFAHIVLIGEEFIYIIVRLTDEKSKKLKILELNSQLENLWQEKNRLIKERHAERNLLISDIHDGFGSMLASLRISVERGLISERELSNHLKQLSTDLHLIVDTLGSEKFTLEDALNDMRHRIRQYFNDSGTTIAWNLNIDPSYHFQPRDILDIARIIQEAIANALRHAKANHISVKIKTDPIKGLLQCSIEDDGLGFQENFEPGFGVSSMRQRAQKIGAIFNIKSLPKGGSSIDFSLPIKAG